MIRTRKAAATLLVAGTLGALVGLAPQAFAKATFVDANCFRAVGTSYLIWDGMSGYDNWYDNHLAIGLYYQGTRKDYESVSGDGWNLRAYGDSRTGVTGGKKWYVDASAWNGSNPWIGARCYVT
ncbi:hypothetical protein OIE66_12275 [Nonomuraea sp. NBC_01738]|uniref:hypothetical protein n=1 Tax=Nonomuraea sp. NBC_01738 TaxID=2976003 RepID=UPI002E14BEA1|nr:hypothetical protein OIE66_12275 [Nonomuraea sp. NBC_01738]